MKGKLRKGAIEMNKKQIMKRAWEIARNGAKKFGGKVREYFAIALSIAWKEVKAMATKLIGSEKQVKWAKDIIARIEAAKPKMKKACVQFVNERPAKTEDAAKRKKESLNEALAFIDSLTDFPLFKNQASMYITYFRFIKKEEDAYELLWKLFLYDDVCQMISKRAKNILENAYRKINREMVMGE